MARNENIIDVEAVRASGEAFDQETTVALDKALREGAALAAVVTQEQVQLSEMVGMIRAFSFTQKFLTVGYLKMLSNIKESKKYKDLQITDLAGNVRRVGNFAELCAAIGLSDKKVYEDLQNLQLLGEDFLETSQSLGLGYRQLRALRKLPDDERQLVINNEAVRLGDKEALVELIEDLADKQAQLKRDLEDARENEQANARRLVEKDTKINDLVSKLEKAQRKRLTDIQQATPDQVLEEILAVLSARTLRVRNCIQDLAQAIEAAIQHTSAHGGDVADLLAGHLAQIVRDIAMLREQHDLKDAADGLTDDERLRAEVAQWAGTGK